MNNMTYICGFPVSTKNLLEHHEMILESVSSYTGAWYVTLNTEMISRSEQDPEYRSLLQKADVIVADGMPLVWASRMMRDSSSIEGRTTGVDLVEMLLSKQNDIAFAVIGGVDPGQTVARYRNAVDNCKYLFTGIVNFSEAQTDAFVAELQNRKVRIVYIALGAPKQDYLAIALRTKLPELIYIGVGGTFEILGPSGSRAPEWMGRIGLEWFFRLQQEPGRLWRRYFLRYPVGIFAILKELFKSEK